MPDPADHGAIIAHHSEEIAGMKTAINGIQQSLGELQSGQKEISKILSDAGKTNWPILIGTVVAVMGLLLSMAVVMYGAAIHPLNQDITRNEANAATLALAVNEQNKAIQTVQMVQARHSDQLDTVREAVKRFDEQGSAAADKRLTLIEWRLEHENK